MSRAWPPASVLTCTPCPPPPRPSICLWLTSCLPSFMLNTCLCPGLRPRCFLAQPAGGRRSPCPAHLLMTLSSATSVLRPQASNYAKLIKIQKTDVAKDPWQAAGARQSDEEEPWRLKDGGSAGVRRVSEGNRNLRGSANKAGQPTGWKNKRLLKLTCFQREFRNKTAFKDVLSQL